MTNLPYGPGPNAREKYLIYWNGQIETAVDIINEAKAKLGELAVAETQDE